METEAPAQPLSLLISEAWPPGNVGEGRGCIREKSCPRKVRPGGRVVPAGSLEVELEPELEPEKELEELGKEVSPAPTSAEAASLLGQTLP